MHLHHPTPFFSFSAINDDYHDRQSKENSQVYHSVGLPSPGDSRKMKYTLVIRSEVFTEFENILRDNVASLNSQPLAKATYMYLAPDI